RVPVLLRVKLLASVLPALLFAITPLITTGPEPAIISPRAVALSGARNTLPLSVVVPTLFEVSVRVLEPEPVKFPLNVKSFEPPIVPLAAQVVAFAILRAPLTAVSVMPLLSDTVDVENALSLPTASIVPAPMEAPARAVDPV